MAFALPLGLGASERLRVSLFRQDKKVREKQKKKKEEQRRKPERFTNLRAKWDGNGMRDREIGKGEGWRRLEREEVGEREGLRGGGGRRRGGRNETKFSLAISVFLLQVLGPFH